MLIGECHEQLSCHVKTQVLGLSSALRCYERELAAGQHSSLGRVCDAVAPILQLHTLLGSKSALWQQQHKLYSIQLPKGHRLSGVHA
jgi:hypothetical protein